MRTPLPLILFFFLTFLLSPFAQAQQGASGVAVSAAEEKIYICPMHPHITGGKGDTCPLCGMALVPKQESPQPHTQKDSYNTFTGEVTLTPADIQTLGVKTRTVAYRTFGETIRAFGQIVPDTRREYPIAVRTDGLIRNLSALAVGDKVKKGDTVFTLYSPDLVVAQQDYLTRGTAGVHRLRILGTDEEAIAQLNKDRTILYDVPFHAPADGVITALNIRTGSAIKAGETAVVIEDLSMLWVMAQIPQRESPRLTEDSTAQILLPGSTQTLPGVVERLLPQIDEETRSATVRLRVENTQGLIKPGQYVDVVFTPEKRESLCVPSQSVLRNAQSAYVIRSLGDGRFASTPVKTGIEADGQTEILSGLEAGEEVVANGQFLIDAESTLRSGTSRMEEPAKDAPMNREGNGHVH
ncbi:MAG TPA: efflux RND transporter periplasmic adaptor subunit [Alphaproteobacteria bacterium]|nr:efflux RND transporter periplasmic adaptor subunit [Alphaproteobacteria bacterium]